MSDFEKDLLYFASPALLGRKQANLFSFSINCLTDYRKEIDRYKKELAGGLRPLGQLPGALLHHRVAALGVAWHHHILGDVLLIGDHFPLRPLRRVHDGLGVGHPGAHLQQHRGVELLGQLIGQLGEGQGLGGVGGLQHGHLGGDGVVAGVLLVLRGVHPRVVGHTDDHAAVHPGVAHGEHPSRSKWYHNYGYGNLRDYPMADHKVAIEQLCARYKFMDINRVGIHGHSGGGFMSTAAMLLYPDFFKVAVSCAGNHDNNIYNRWWGV